MQSLPVLYSFRRCPYAMRARFALAASSQPCTLREVVLRNKPQALLDASPKGTVPVLVLPDGSVIDQSLDIMMWALGRHDPQSWLKPDTGSLEDMCTLVAENDGPFKTHLDRYKYPNRYRLDTGERDRDAAIPWLMDLNKRLCRTPWLFGQHRRLADMAIAPFVRQYAHTDRDWFHAQSWDALSRWLRAFLDDPLFAAVMEKYPAWEPGQAEVVFAG